MVFYSALPLISIINEDQSWRDLENIPQINIAFPNGQFDNLILERFYASAESRKAGKPHCNFIGHLENEPTACVAVTGCYGVDNVEFTIKSRHLLLSNSFVMDPNSNLKEILVMGRTMFEVRCSIVRSQKLGVRVRLQIDEHVQVHSMFEKMMFESVR